MIKITDCLDEIIVNNKLSAISENPICYSNEHITVEQKDSNSGIKITRTEESSTIVKIVQRDNKIYIIFKFGDLQESTIILTREYIDVTNYEGAYKKFGIHLEPGAIGFSWFDLRFKKEEDVLVSDYSYETIIAKISEIIADARIAGATTFIDDLNELIGAITPAIILCIKEFNKGCKEKLSNALDSERQKLSKAKSIIEREEISKRIKELGDFEEEFHKAIKEGQTK